MSEKKKQQKAFEAWIASESNPIRTMKDDGHPLPITFEAGWSAAIEAERITDLDKARAEIVALKIERAADKVQLEWLNWYIHRNDVARFEDVG
jgi:uncharacterized membrane protein YfhO